MATKKKTEETEVILDTKEAELAAALAEARKEKEALLAEVERLKAKDQKNKPVKTKRRDEEYWNEKIPYEAFYDGNEYADDISVKVNGRRFLIKRGERVMLPRNVVNVLENQAKQQKYAAAHNRALQDEFEKDTKKYLG